VSSSIGSDGPRRPGRKWKLALVGVAGVYVVLAGYDLISSSGDIGIRTVASASESVPSAVPAAASRAGTSSPSASPPTARSTRAATVPAGNAAPGPATDPLVVESVAAFGPAGTADGDNPGIASRILNVATDQPWYSQWYTSPEFGRLQSGTGLLLDMGKTVTVRDVQLSLGGATGADVQVRVGNGPFLDLPTVASAWGVGGDVQLTATAPAQGQYVLVWFTRLPSDSDGHYQISVYSVAVDG
jgi:hypothetical protein